MLDELSKASQTLGLNLSTLETAATSTEKDVAKFKSLVSEYWSGPPPQNEIKNVDLVLLGSIARQEVTGESDCDYVVLQNGCTPDMSQSLLLIAERVRTELGYAPPGRQAVFGDIVIAGSLYERIGLESDTNQNLTHRMLLLTESISVFSQLAHDEVIDNILRRYCADYLPPRRETGHEAMVPRHFVNDLVRFWRTMAVDFGAKRWRSFKDDSHLRLIKLRTTRKILFAGPLCSLLLVPQRINTADELPQYLRQWLNKPPLAQLASLACDDNIKLSADSSKALGQVLVAYDSLLGLFNERGTREALKNPDSVGKVFKEANDKCHEIAETIESGLETIFFDDPIFKSTFRKYSVF